MIKNIVFDFGNVLLKWDEDELASYYSDNIDEKNIIKEVIFKSEEWHKLDEGKMTYDEAKKIFKDKFPNKLKEKVEYIMSTWYKHLAINIEICDLIKKLKQNGYKIFAFSNTHIVIEEYVKSLEVGKYFDGYLISAIEQKLKPNEEIYKALFEKFKLDPKETFFVDDSEKNIFAGKKLGMDGFVFDMNDIKSLKKELRNKNVNI